MRIEVRGPLRGPSGYDRLTREFTRALAELGVQVQLRNIEGWSPELPRDKRAAWFESLTSPLDPDCVLHFMMPNRCCPRPDKPNFNYTMCEANGIPADWVTRAKDYHRIIVPTETCRAAWVRSGVPEPQVKVCPLGVDGEFFGAGGAEFVVQGLARPLSSYRTRFLNVAELRPRKNHIGLLRVWISATQSNDDAILIVKCISSPYLFQIFQEDLMRMQIEIGKSFAQAAPVILLTNLMGDEEMRSLYHAATHYISMSNGEGWDLPMMEAAVAGLQLIAPDHSGYQAYLTQGDAVLIPAREVAARFEGRAGWEDHIFFDGLSWWRPDENVAAGLIAQIVRGNARPQPSPAQRILRDFSWARAASCLLKIFKD